MELQDSRFVNFISHSWIRNDKFNGVSRICAIFLNFLLLLLKLITCGVIMIVLAPHLAASALRNKPKMSMMQRIIYVLLVMVSLTMDIPLLLVCIVCVLVAGRLLIDGQVISAAVCGVICWGLIRLTLPLLRALFRRSKAREVDADDNEEEEEPIEYEPHEDEDDIDFCQLFTIGEDMCLLIDHIEMCPDETAFIRVVDDEGYTPLYRRKVRRDKSGRRLIVFNSTNHYLDDSKTQPIITKK